MCECVRMVAMETDSLGQCSKRLTRQEKQISCWANWESGSQHTGTSVLLNDNAMEMYILLNPLKPASANITMHSSIILRPFVVLYTILCDTRIILGQISSRSSEIRQRMALLPLEIDSIGWLRFPHLPGSGHRSWTSIKRVKVIINPLLKVTHISFVPHWLDLKSQKVCHRLTVWEDKCWGYSQISFTYHNKG